MKGACVNFVGCIFLISILSACRVQVQWPLETYFTDSDVIEFPLWTQKRGGEFFQKTLSIDGDNTTFAIGFPEKKRGLVLEVNCETASYHILETLRQRKSGTFLTDDAFFQLDSFGVGIRYLRFIFEKPVSSLTLPHAVGTELCSAPAT
jgi:hypothetical protein